MASIQGIVVQIRNVLKTIPGLNVPDGIPNSITQLPCVPQVIPETGEFNADFGGNDKYVVVITLVVGRANFPSILNKILPFFDIMKDKFDLKQNLNGSVDWCRLAGFRDLGRFELSGEEYFGAEFVLEVMG